MLSLPPHHASSAANTQASTHVVRLQAPRALVSARCRRHRVSSRPRWCQTFTDTAGTHDDACEGKCFVRRLQLPGRHVRWVRVCAGVAGCESECICMILLQDPRSMLQARRRLPPESLLLACSGSSSRRLCGPAGCFSQTPKSPGVRTSGTRALDSGGDFWEPLQLGIGSARRRAHFFFGAASLRLEVYCRVFVVLQTGGEHFLV